MKPSRFGRLINFLICNAVASCSTDYSAVAQSYTPEQLEWAHNLQAPVTGWRCSDLEDAAFVQQDIRLGADGLNHWFVRLEAEWVQVPDEAIIQSGNQFREPIVWYSGGAGVFLIRCFVAGALF